MIALLALSTGAPLCATAQQAADTGTESQDGSETRVFPTYIFPPAGHVQFNNIQTEWLQGKATPTVVISVEPQALVNSIPRKTTEIKELSLELTTDNGLTWKEYALAPAGDDTARWSVTIEIPEWAEKEDPPSPAETPAAAQPEPETKVINGATIEGADDGYEPGLKKSSLNAVSDKDKNTATGADTGNAVEPAGTNRSAAICFYALDANGNSTVEVPHQASAFFESDVRFKLAMTDPAERAGIRYPKYEESPNRDITHIGVAWLNKMFYIKLMVEGSLEKNRQLSPGLNFFVLRLVKLDTNAISEQAGQGMLHYFLANPDAIDWPRTNPFGDDPFYLIIDEEKLGKMVQLFNTPEDQLSDDDKLFMESVKEKKLDPLAEIYDTVKIEEKILETRTFLNRAYWKIDREAITKGSNVKRGFRINIFSGYMREQEDYELIIDDRTNYATVFLRHYVLKQGSTGIEAEYSEDKLIPDIEKSQPTGKVITDPDELRKIFDRSFQP